ncbi:AIPR family protein [Kistimonas scapharcae]|uniref:AIPR family protein n=1 Tax=Kistimonas scapharcae TaxID=1036133 RepID=A0ABP8UWV2_9GAMM
MRDEILKSYVSTFIEQNDLSEMDYDKAFERFVNLNIVSKLYPREIDFEDLSTGGTKDLAIDGAAIIVNGNIVKAPEEIDYFLQKNGTLDVSFALIQSKTSSKFAGDKIGSFIFGIKSLFDKEASVEENEKIKQIREIKDKIYQHSIDFEEAPELNLFFVTTGEWKDPEQIEGRVRRELKDLDDKHLFSNKASIEFYDAERLKNTYREISRKSVKEIHFNNHVALPDIPGDLNIRQSFIGSVSAKSYLELISDSDGKLSKELFYDNVRDYQGTNKVNKEIQETLKSLKSQCLLPLLNNGITIIAKKVDKIGSKLKLTDYQVVNGCQSSHVLFENKKLVSEDTHIILKIIDTTDQEVINRIIRATNRQTEVTDEAFESLKPFHKDLQEFYKAKSKLLPFPIFYERRSKEFLGNPSIKPSQIITLAAQIKSYVSIILAQPQSTHRYFGELLESNKEKLFNIGGNLDNYYISSLLVNRLESAFNRNKIYKSYRKFRYHIAYLTYLQIKKQSKNNHEILVTVSKIDDLIPLFIKSCKIIAASSKESSLSDKDKVRSRDFTNQLREAIQ